MDVSISSESTKSFLMSQGSGGFVYRVPSSVQIKDFATGIEDAIRCILPAKTVIDLQLDDGSPTVGPLTTVGKRQSVIGGAPIEPVTIKVTPLRPLFKVEDNEKCFRGSEFNMSLTFCTITNNSDPDSLSSFIPSAGMVPTQS